MRVADDEAMVEMTRRHRTYGVSALVGVAAWCLVPMMAVAQRPQIRGRVLDQDGAAVAGAEVLVPSQSRSAITDTSGRFVLTAAGPGPARGVVRGIGFEPLFFESVLSVADTLEVEFTVRRRPQQLAPVVVEATPRRFDEAESRRSSGLGQYLDEPALRARSGGRLVDLLRELRGVRIGPGSNPLATRGGGISQASCPLRLYVDGFRVDADTGRMLEHMLTDDVRAVEVYVGPSETPPEFGGTGALCGVLLVWLRR